MKNKAKRQFHNQFKWYDYSYLLQAVELWCANASKMHLTKGHHLNKELVAKKLKVMSELAKRLGEANHSYYDVKKQQPYWEPEYDYTISFEPSDEKGFSEIKSRDCKFVYDSPERKEVIPVSEDDPKIRKLVKLQHNRIERQRKQDLEMLCNMLKRNLFSLWD